MTGPVTTQSRMSRAESSVRRGQALSCSADPAALLVTSPVTAPAQYMSLYILCLCIASAIASALDLLLVLTIADALANQGIAIARAFNRPPRRLSLTTLCVSICHLACSPPPVCSAVGTGTEHMSADRHVHRGSARSARPHSRSQLLVAGRRVRVPRAERWSHARRERASVHLTLSSVPTHISHEI